MKIQADGMHFKELNEQIRAAADNTRSSVAAWGQRYIATAWAAKKSPSTAFRAMRWAPIWTALKSPCWAMYRTRRRHHERRQHLYPRQCRRRDRVRDARRQHLVRDSTGYRAGIHMKAYQEKVPVLVIGGTAWQLSGRVPGGRFDHCAGQGRGRQAAGRQLCGTGMHGGRIFLRCDAAPEGLPAQVAVHPATEEELAEIRPYIEEFCTKFDEDIADIISKTFYILTPNTKIRINGFIPETKSCIIKGYRADCR